MGVYLIVEVLLVTSPAVPFEGEEILPRTTLRASPSGSVSLLVTLMTTEASSVVVAVSSTAVGGALGALGVAFAPSDGAPLPLAFTARTWKLYSVPLLSPVTV